MLHLKTILHATDLAEDRRFALDLACALARDQMARLVLLHVLPRAAPIGTDARVPAFKDAHTAADLQAYRQEVTVRLDNLRKSIRLSNVETLLREGDTAEVILGIAEQVSCNLIVLGTAGPTAPDNLSEAVVRHARCPVVTVHEPAKR